MIKITTLFSGSKGNCSLIQTDNINILLDIGFGYKPIIAKLQTLGLKDKDINAIVITHEHTDHISALAMWTKHCATAVYAPEAIADYISQRSYCSEVVAIDKPFSVGDVDIDFYACSHDAICCYGYRFTNGGESIASVTDTGCITQELVTFLSPCKTIQLESNHDINMLKQGPYSFVLKRRILSDFGHLSNDQTAELLVKLVGSKVKNVILAHLSENNNTKELAFMGAVSALSKCNVVEGRDVNVYVATQNGLGVTIE